MRARLLHAALRDARPRACPRISTALSRRKDAIKLEPSNARLPCAAIFPMPRLMCHLQPLCHKPQSLPDEPWSSPLGAAWRASSRERKRRKRRKQGRHSPRPSRQHPSTGSVVLWLCCSPEICAASALVAKASPNRKDGSLSSTTKSARTDAQSVRTCSAIPIVCLIAGTLRVEGASTARPSRLDSLPTMDGAATILPMIGKRAAA